MTAANDIEDGNTARRSRRADLLVLAVFVSFLPIAIPLAFMGIHSVHAHQHRQWEKEIVGECVSAPPIVGRVIQFMPPHPRDFPRHGQVKVASEAGTGETVISTIDFDEARSAVVACPQ